MEQEADRAYQPAMRGPIQFGAEDQEAMAMGRQEQGLSPDQQHMGRGVYPVLPPSKHGRRSPGMPDLDRIPTITSVMISVSFALMLSPSEQPAPAPGSVGTVTRFFSRNQRPCR